MVPEKRVIECVLIRHGKTQGNIEKRYIGCHTDEPLSEAGIAELFTIRNVPEEEPLFVSPLRRARQTAELLFPGRPQIVIDKLTESDFGRFEGKNYEELNGDPDYQHWIDSGGTEAFPGGEAPEAFRKRSFEGFEEAVKQAVKKGAGRIWIVAHGGTVMSVMSRLTGKEYFDFMVSCGEGYACTCEVTEQTDGTVHFTCTHYRPYPEKEQINRV